MHELWLHAENGAGARAGAGLGAKVRECVARDGLAVAVAAAAIITVYVIAAVVVFLLVVIFDVVSPPIVVFGGALLRVSIFRRYRFLLLVPR